jgi:predicted acyl esterase
MGFALSPSPHLGARLWGYDNAVETIIEGGYIRVVQDIHGKYDSEGDNVMTRPMRGPLNPTPVDESTDTYDTIDRLVKNVPESNGKVGALGISYDGFLPLTAMVNPHPALKVDVQSHRAHLPCAGPSELRRTAAGAATRIVLSAPAQSLVSS